MSDSKLKLVIVGQGSTRGRRGHYLRLRESLWWELNEVSQGPEGPRVEWCIQHAIEYLRSRKDLLVVRTEEMDAKSIDFELLEQRELRIAKSGEAVKGRKPSATKPPSEVKKPPATKKAPSSEASPAPAKPTKPKKST